MECTAQPMAESSTVEIQPPWTVPSGFKKRGEGLASNTTRPGSTSVIQMSVSWANGGAGNTPLRSFSRNSRPVIAVATSRGTTPMPPVVDSRAIVGLLLVPYRCICSCPTACAFSSRKFFQHAVERGVERAGIAGSEHFLDMALRASPGRSRLAQQVPAFFRQMQAPRTAVRRIGREHHESLSLERPQVAGQRRRIHHQLL